MQDLYSIQRVLCSKKCSVTIKKETKIGVNADDKITINNAMNFSFTKQLYSQREIQI